MNTDESGNFICVHRDRFRQRQPLSIPTSLASRAAAAIAQPADAGKGVQPESLEQGFILLVTDKPGRASSDSPISVASNHNGWNPGDPTQRLTRRSDGKWQIALNKPKLNSRMAFKLTRGNWDTVECAADFKDLDNRNLPLIDPATVKVGEKPVIELTVEHWRDERPNEPVRLGVNPYREIKISAGRLARVEVTGGGVSPPPVRDVLVWLPPGYDDAANAKTAYPVLYMQDGQNLFDTSGGAPGEWQADETAAMLIKDGTVPAFIIVGIPAAGAKRTIEYLPLEIFENSPAGGDAYVDFVVHEVMPRVERAFRVQTGREHTVIGGSSLGAIIALHAALRYPDRFGGVILESTPLLAKDRAAFAFFEKSAAKQWPSRAFVGMGDKEVGDDAGAAMNAKYAESARELAALLKTKGVPEGAITTVIGAGESHNEAAWAKRFPAALKAVFRK